MYSNGKFDSFLESLRETSRRVIHVSEVIEVYCEMIQMVLL